MPQRYHFVLNEDAKMEGTLKVPFISIIDKLL